jgi:hypothetical protein
VARAIPGIIFKNQGVLLEFYGPWLDFAERQGANCKMVGIFPGADLFFNRKIMVDSVHHPWTTGMPVHGGLAMPGRRGLTGARPSGPSGAQWVTGGGATEGGVHGVSTSGLTGARAAMWRLVDDGEEMAVEVLGAGGAWAQREKKESGRGVVENDGGLPLYRGRGGWWLVIKMEKRPTLMGTKWLAFK